MSQIVTFVSLSVLLRVCFNFVHHCTKFQTGNTKLLLENYKNCFFVFLAISTFDTTFWYMSISCIFLNNGADINCVIIFKFK